MATTTAEGTAGTTGKTGIAERTIPCKIEGCKRPYRAKGYCTVHYQKWRRGELEAKPRYKTCNEENCNKPLYRKGYCEQHYSAWSVSKKGGEAKAEAEVKAEEKPVEAEPAETKPAEEKSSE